MPNDDEVLVCFQCGRPEPGPYPIHHGCPNCGSQDDLVTKRFRDQLLVFLIMGYLYRWDWEDPPWSMQ